jgi:hypothetical protein
MTEQQGFERTLVSAADVARLPHAVRYSSLTVQLPDHFNSPATSHTIARQELVIQSHQTLILTVKPVCYTNPSFRRIPAVLPKSISMKYAPASDAGQMRDGRLRQPNGSSTGGTSSPRRRLTPICCGYTSKSGACNPGVGAPAKNIHDLFDDEHAGPPRGKTFSASGRTRGSPMASAPRT